MSESTQQKLSRVRPPRVQITYDVETGGAIEKKPLAFVVGIMADLSRQAVSDNAPLQDRPFVEIDRDNFAAVMAQLKPKLTVKVANPDSEDDPFVYPLEFASLDDFGPAALVKKLGSEDEDGTITALWKRRQALRDMLTKLDGNDALLKKLKDATASGDNLHALISEADSELAKLEPSKTTGGNDSQSGTGGGNDSQSGAGGGNDSLSGAGDGNDSQSDAGGGNDSLSGAGGGDTQTGPKGGGGT